MPLYNTATTALAEPVGLDFWMTKVIRECDRVRHDFAPESVHDLRVALRRCRSMADGFMTFDPHPAWPEMRQEGKRLFRQLGALRDTQVVLNWVQRLAPAGDPVAVVLNHYLADQEVQQKEGAWAALQNFNDKKWTSWIRKLQERTHQVSPESMVFQHLALEQWHQARELHRQALRNRTHVGYHRLRIGLKRFRYTLENFLPARHEQWGEDLRELQDLLGEMHDLDVLWQTALRIGVRGHQETRRRWQHLLDEERRQRLDRYRRKMVGREALWQVWRGGLPGPDEIKVAAMARLRTWASFRDPDFAHSEYVAQLALQIYDGLNSSGLTRTPGLMDARSILHAAALMHDVGLAITQKEHHKASYSMIRKLDPPLGCSAECLYQVALVARYHHGPIPRPEHKCFARIPKDKRKGISLIAGILRLANAFDLSHDKRIRRLEVRRVGEVLDITAEGYSENDPLSERLAGARHLLEVACRLPILIRSAGRRGSRR